MKNIKPIAIHLPQFHPIPENDEWWGKGFTEWTNVTKATPRFDGHHQPHLPADLGFYDLRLKEARLAQEKLAKEYGIYGFCYYHYWFNGKLLLETPIEEKLKNPDEDFPFMLCWANENWTRIWDGGSNNILMEQNYDDEDHINHIKYLIPFFKDERYIKIDGKPVFALYRSTLIPNIEEVIRLWKNEAQKEGLELYIIRFETAGIMGKQYMTESMDAAAEFQPHYAMKFYRDMLQQRKEKEILEEKRNFKTLKDEISFTTIQNSFITRLLGKRKSYSKEQIKESGVIIDYGEFIDIELEKSEELSLDYKLYPCVSPGFDNTARKKENYWLLKNNAPNLFQKWIETKITRFTPYSRDENLFFINAWNEWAEGNHLEPDTKWGLKFLEVVKETFGNIK